VCEESGHLQLSNVGKVTAANLAHLGSFQGRDCGRVSIKCDKLYLVSLSVLVHVDYGANVSRFEPFAEDWRVQNNAVVFLIMTSPRVDKPLPAEQLILPYPRSKPCERLESCR
jgi:hypothetical protein